MDLDPFAVPNVPQRLYPYPYRMSNRLESYRRHWSLIYFPNEISKTSLLGCQEDLVHCCSRHPSNFYIILFSPFVRLPIISLFSSTGSDPLTLFRTSVDKSLPSDSFLHFPTQPIFKSTTPSTSFSFTSFRTIRIS